MTFSIAQNLDPLIDAPPGGLSNRPSASDARNPRRPMSREPRSRHYFWAPFSQEPALVPFPPRSAMPPTTYANCAPTLGWGGFDLVVTPPSSLDVRIRCYFEAEAAVGPVNFDDFLADWQTAVSAMWDDKIRIRSTARPNEDLSVRFQLTRASTLAGCHFPILIKSGGYAAGAGLYFPDRGLFGGTRMYLKLGMQDNQTWLQGSRQNIQAGVPGARAGMFMGHHDRVMQSLPGHGTPGFHDALDITMTLTGTAWGIAPADQGRVDALCAQLAATPPWLPQPPVRISAASGVQAKIDAITVNVRNYMIGKGVNNVSVDRNPILTRRKARNPFRAANTTKAVTIEVLPVTEMVRRCMAGQAIADNVVSAHEFGHLLGLPDEYLNYSRHMAGSAVMVNSQPAWDTLCGRHAPPVPTRSWNDAYNDSMMSVGTTIYKAHAITIWDCLTRASGEGWTITRP